MPDDDLDGRIAVCKIRVLRAARNFSKSMAEFDGDLAICGEDMNEVMDAADRLMELEALKDA
jgi:hypothetical protein